MIDTLVWGMHNLGHSHVEMGRGEVEFHPCGTPGCFAGAFGAAQADKCNLPKYGSGCNPYYDKHANNIAKLILPTLTDGKEEEPESVLGDFLGENDHLWGNPFGARVFGRGYAFTNVDEFGNEVDSKVSLCDVINRLEEFRNNVVKAL